MSQWWETVDLENQDRKNRLDRLADIMPGVQAPRYFQETIPRHKLGKLLDGTSLQGIPVLRVVFENRVFFDTAKSRLRPEAQRVIDLVAESLRREPPDVAVFIAGHADSRGSDNYNYNLSVDRANTVARALVNRGVGLAAIWRVGFGESVPLRSNATHEGMAQNRRVEFLFASKPAAVAAWLSQQGEDPCIGTSAGDTQHCKRKIMVRRKFQAVPIIKGQEINVPPPPKAVKLGGKHGSAPAPRVRKVQVDINKIDPIIIDLENDTFTVPAPQI